MLFLPDLVVKTLNGTSQGIALPLFLFALYFTLRGRRRAFFITAVAILFTHHLTGLVTLVLYYTMWVLPRSRDPGFLRTEWPYLLFFAAWPVYWAWTFSRTSETYLAPIFLLLAIAFGAPLAGLLYLAAPHARRATDWAGARIASFPARAVLALAVVAALVAWFLSGLALETPGLSDQAPANRTVVALYAALLVFGGAAVLARRHLGLTLFVATLLGLGLVDLGAGCQHVFDALRVVDYTILGGLAALFSPGVRPRWATIASDTKMSLLILGEGGRNATYEGTWWLFDGSPVRPIVATLNGASRFRDRPIRYVALSDYMLERGAEIAWFSATVKPDRALPQRIDDLGHRVYDRGGVTIWELDPVCGVDAG